ncbi:hypothetical protein GUJ93_ZPchr0005g14305 [Zizania palustris]|uniref:Uncharacterized protein n=1 Tax=Zizania palustris TaxID=103762 RepID=A0A8J5VIB4_ZIZPA|nr:hypothetical protein GUJ93_ZPchr0005g14305 [Zizania palustris]
MHEASCQPKKRDKPDGSTLILAYGNVNFQFRKEYAVSFPAKAINERWYSNWQGPFARFVAALGILHHLEAIGGAILVGVGTVPVIFAGGASSL